MIIQNYAETLDFQDEDIPHPGEYNEALKDCTALATNLLSLAVNGETIKRCWDCSFWVGRCLKDIPNRAARDEACDKFES